MKMTIVIFILLITAIFVNSYVYESDVQELYAWVHSQGQTVQTIDQCIWNTGPYLHLKSARHYRIQTDKNIYWVRYRIKMHIEQEINGNYKTVKE